MFGTVLAMAAALGLAPSADYAPAESVLAVCGDPHLVVIIRRLQKADPDDRDAARIMRSGRCDPLILQDHVFVDFVEDVPWKVEPSGAHGVAKVVRGRYPAGNGTWVYFYGLASDFRYVGAKP
jgi:hypothetical protein